MRDVTFWYTNKQRLHCVTSDYRSNHCDSDCIDATVATS